MLPATCGLIDQIEQKLFGQFAGSILHVTHGVVDVALILVELTFGLKLLVISQLAGRFLDVPFALSAAPFTCSRSIVYLLQPCTCQCMAS